MKTPPVGIQKNNSQTLLLWMNLSHHYMQEFFLPDAPLEDLSQWHIHRFSPSSEDLSEKSQEGLDEAELIESPEGSKVILHCFDCDSEPQIWRSADGEQREKFFFHKVRVDTPYDPFTKRPYHHSILAVKAFPSMTKVRDREEDTANKTSSGELQYYKDQLHINHTSKPYFTVKNNSNIYHINSINYKSFITQNPGPYLEEK
ncbi:hypothetical protein Avbf_12478 [Armadillidium vulgare]|nr:hypothetical protein Avbf_12478 [Armadillidium vulgare]